MNYYNYYTEIEDTFVRRRAKHLLLSPLDWALMEVWQERGIPLHVALRAIESVFDAFDKKPTTRTIKGLMFGRKRARPKMPPKEPAMSFHRRSFHLTFQN